MSRSRYTVHDSPALPNPLHPYIFHNRTGHSARGELIHDESKHSCLGKDDLPTLSLQTSGGGTGRSVVYKQQKQQQRLLLRCPWDVGRRGGRIGRSLLHGDQEAFAVTSANAAKILEQVLSFPLLKLLSSVV